MGAAIGLCAVVVVIVIDEGRITIGRPRVALAREILVFGMKSQVAGAADVVLYQSGKLIAGIVIGPAAAGAYELGIRLIQGVQAFGGAAAVAINTHLTRAYATAGMGGIREQYSRLTRRNAAVAIFLPFLLGTTAFSAVPLWLGEQPRSRGDRGHRPRCRYRGKRIDRRVQRNHVRHRTGRDSSGRRRVAYATVSVVLAIPLAVAFGFNGLVAAYAGWIALGNLLGVWFLQSRIGIPMRDFLGAIAGPFAVAILASIVAMPINLIAAPDDRAHAIAPFLVSSVVFCAIYIALGWRLDYLPRVRGHAQPPPTPTQRPQHCASPNAEFASETPLVYASESEVRDGKQPASEET